MIDVKYVEERLGFDVERLRAAAARLSHLEEALDGFRRHLEVRARHLARDASDRARSEPIRAAQAQATAHLARRAVLLEVLSPSTALSLIAAMATRHWVSALRGIAQTPRGEAMIRGHVETGRIAYRVLLSIRRNRGLVPGVGQLASAAVVAGFAHPADRTFVDEQLEEGLFRARGDGLRAEDDALASASLALREAALVLELLAKDAEPKIQKLLEEADGLEHKIERELRRGR
jgi:hypothetical protein